MNETNSIYDLMIVDDDKDTLGYLAGIIESARDRSVSYLQSCEEALDRWQGCGAQVLLTDIEFPGMSGLELVTKLRSHSPELLAFAMTGGGVGHFDGVAFEHVFRKPFCPDELLGRLTGALEQRRGEVCIQANDDGLHGRKKNC